MAMANGMGHRSFSEASLGSNWSRNWSGPGHLPDYFWQSGGQAPLSAEDERQLAGPHPLSAIRKECRELPYYNMSKLRKIRAQCNFVMHKSTSHTCVSEAGETDEHKPKEFMSHGTQMYVRRKHQRSPLSPVAKYRGNTLASHAIGWHAEGDYGASLTRTPKHGLSSSTVTKIYDNMVATNMTACLRSSK
mmetsp:Transcript_89622/g.141483  ORF Transcript_89622/g.141483 Transcript_89622/m.141483 type:complete len:190 (+) Transcript_89622:48-617(+)